MGILKRYIGEIVVLYFFALNFVILSYIFIKGDNPLGGGIYDSLICAMIIGGTLLLWIEMAILYVAVPFKIQKKFSNSE